MHNYHLLLCAGHLVRRDLVMTTRILVLRLAAEPFLLDTRHVQDIRVRKHFFQGAVISLQDKTLC